MDAVLNPDSMSSGDLDPLMLQGDETWDMEAWNWDPFNMFAAPKEVPSAGACCQALKKRRVEPSAFAAQQYQQQQQQQQPGHAGDRAGSQSAAGCNLHLSRHQMADSLFGTANGGVSSNTCAMPVSGRAPDLAPSAPAANMANTGGAGGHMGTAPTPANLGGWASMSAASSFGFFAGGQGPLAALGWGSQALSMPMYGTSALALPAFMGSHAQSAAELPMSAFQGSGSGMFNRQVTATALPSPALGSCGDTSSLQASAKPACCSGNRAARGPGCSGGRQQADSLSKPAAQPLKGYQGLPHSGYGAMDAAALGGLSDLDFSDSDEEEEAPRRGPAQQQQHKAAPSLLPPPQLQQVMRDVVALNDVMDENGVMTCQVPGCGKDLTNLKEYHQRYRICDVHIKLQQVLKDGRLQRFCQQCGRFHDLTAFDGSRKSCRDQLSKHNARRRRRTQAEQAKTKAAAHDGGAASAAAVATAAAAAAGGAVVGGDVNKLLACLTQNPAQLSALRMVLGVHAQSAAQPGSAFSPADSTSDGSEQLRAFSQARDILGGRNEFAPAFESEHRLVRLSMKLLGKAPSDLPLDLRNQVTSWMASAPPAMEAAIRPGCVFLTVQMLVDAATAEQVEAPGALACLARHLLTRTGCAFWQSGTYTLQLGADMLLVRDGELCGALRGDGDVRVPALHGVGPLAAVAGEPVELELTGANLDAANSEVIVRWGGNNIKARLHAASGERATVHLPPLPADLVGPVWVEVSRGAYLSSAKPLLVCGNRELVAEINRLDAWGLLPSRAADALLHDLALVLQRASGQPGVAAQLEHAGVVLKARRLLVAACALGCGAAAAAVLPLASEPSMCVVQPLTAARATHCVAAGADRCASCSTACRAGSAVVGRTEWLAVA